MTGISGASGSTQSWTINVPAGASNLVIATSGGSGDADLYVRFGSAPTTSAYDCRPYRSGNAESCSFASPQAGTYHVMLRGYSAFSGVTLTGSYSAGGGGGTQTYSNGTDYPINDNSTVESPMTVSGRSGNAPNNTPVAIDIRHTYRADLKVDLVAPDGSVYVLHNRTGGSADNIIGTYTVNLSSEPRNGTWRLRVNDNWAGDTGYINSWSITF
nr:pre-peptidase C-terminal domain-containing protein [Luteimonas marina]